MSSPTQSTRAYAAFSPKEPLAPFKIERRAPGAHDVAIEIHFAGVCHSDIHTARGEWGGTAYPVVPGHEIVGKVTAVGPKVTKHRVGDWVGVGCFVDSCRECENCRAGEEQFCTGKSSFTYNSTEKDGTPTYGGYSERIVVDENYVLRIPTGLDPARAAPLLCAGITTYSPLRRWKVGQGHKLGVVGLGGLGHMAVQIGRALGAEVTVFSTSLKKEADARRLGAQHFELSSNPATFERLAGKLDFIIDTVAAKHDYAPYLESLKTGGTMILVGVPEHASELPAFSLIMKRRQLVGSLIGGIRETQEMLDFCAKHGIASDIERIPIQKINEAYDRTVRGDVHYRFVIETASLSR